MLEGSRNLLVEGSSTEGTTGMSNVDNDWQRPANPETSVGGMALQRPAKQTGWTGDQMVLAVGIWYLTHSWRGLPVVKSASGVGAGALARVRWAMGSRAGRLGWGDRQLQLRRELHPWRRGAGEVELAGSGLEWWTDRRRQ